MAKGKRRPAWRAAVETRVFVRWSDALAGRILRRLAAGEMICRICEEPGMPSREAVAKWARERPEFGEALTLARRTGRRPMGRPGGVLTYCEATADEIFERLCEGESLTRIGADPTMPSLSTIFAWRRRFPEFEEAVTIGKRIQAERFCDLGWEIASSATPETAYLTDVQLKQLRWMAGVNAPRVFRIKTVEPEAPRETLDVLMRTFEIEEDPETGEKKVVAYCPNPDTGRPEREDATSWRPGPNQIPIPNGGRWV